MTLKRTKLLKQRNILPYYATYVLPYIAHYIRIILYGLVLHKSYYNIIYFYFSY